VASAPHARQHGASDAASTLNFGDKTREVLAATRGSIYSPEILADSILQRNPAR